MPCNQFILSLQLIFITSISKQLFSSKLFSKNCLKPMNTATWLFIVSHHLIWKENRKIEYTFRFWTILLNKFNFFIEIWHKNVKDRSKKRDFTISYVSVLYSDWNEKMLLKFSEPQKWMGERLVLIPESAGIWVRGLGLMPSTDILFSCFSSLYFFFALTIVSISHKKWTRVFHTD